MIYVRRKVIPHKNHIAPDVNSPALCGENREWYMISFAIPSGKDYYGYCKKCNEIYRFIKAL